MFANTRFLDMLVIIQTIQHGKNLFFFEKSHNSSDTCTFRPNIYKNDKILNRQKETKTREYNCVFVFYKKSITWDFYAFFSYNIFFYLIWAISGKKFK